MIGIEIKNGLLFVNFASQFIEGLVVFPFFIAHDCLLKRRKE